MDSPTLTYSDSPPVASKASWLYRLLALLILAGCAWGTWTFPAGSAWLLAGFGVYLLLLQVFPHAWLIVLPAAMPVLDLAYWSGRFFFNEFDLLVLITLAWGLWQPRVATRLDRRVALVMVLLLLVQIPIILNGLLPMQAPTPGAWLDYFASTNALREGKGIIWPILLMPMLLAALARKADVRRLFCAGMLTGLALAVGTIVWERLLFTGLFDLSHPYRVSGWFSGMHTGGAAIDAYLALASPFVFSAFFYWRDRRVHALGIVLGLGVIYALYVTYSRANYPAVAVMLLVFAIGTGISQLRDKIRSHAKEAQMFAQIFAVVTVLFLGAGLVGGEHIQSRFSSVFKDLDTRLEHWSRSAAIADETPSARWIGLGKGVFPRAYFWSQQVMGEHLVNAALRREGDEAFVRFSKSDELGSMFLRQRFDAGGGGERLNLKLRVSHGKAERLLIEFCERHILKFLAECQWRGVNIPATTTDWQEFNVPVALPNTRRTALGIFTRPFEVAIMNRGIKQGLDIGAAQIIASGGRTLLSNSEFDAGWDNWFMSYGNHLRWHIKNVFIYWFFEGGLIGLLVMLGLCAYAGTCLLRRGTRGDRFALISASSLAGVMMVGLFDSVFDEPRIAFLTLFMGMAAMQITRAQRQQEPAPIALPVSAPTTETIRPGAKQQDTGDAMQELEQKLRTLHQLHIEGVLSESEYESAKQKVLDSLED